MCEPANPAFTMSDICKNKRRASAFGVFSKLFVFSVVCMLPDVGQPGFALWATPRHFSRYAKSGLPGRSSANPDTARLRPDGLRRGRLRCCAAKLGGANRDRTDDLKLAKLALSQLSYGPDLIGWDGWLAEP